MIIITGSKGFIGQNFLKYLLEHSEEEIITVNEKNAWDWIAFFNDWEKGKILPMWENIQGETLSDKY